MPENGAHERGVSPLLPLKLKRWTHFCSFDNFKYFDGLSDFEGESRRNRFFLVYWPDIQKWDAQM